MSALNYIHHDRYSEENLDMLSMVHQVEFASKQEGKKNTYSRIKIK